MVTSMIDAVRAGTKDWWNSSPSAQRATAHCRKEGPSPPPCSPTREEGARKKEPKDEIFEDVSPLPHDPVECGNLVGGEARKKEGERRSYDREGVLRRECPRGHNEGESEPCYQWEPALDEGCPFHLKSIGYASATGKGDRLR